MRKFSVVWNVTRLCYWKCPFCCVDALFAGKKKVAPSDLTNTGELAFSEKIRVIDELSKLDCRLDLSGGELLLNDENLELISYASKKLKKENVGISVSGIYIDENIAKLLSMYVNEVEVTMDCLPGQKYPLRPIGYHECAATAIQNLKKYNVEVGIQTVLTKDNIDQISLSALFKWILDNNVDSWSLLRFFPSGRGRMFAEKTPSYEEYCDTVNFITSLTENIYSGVHFQYLLPNHNGTTLNCRAGKQSMGILPNGDCISCFWGLSEGMKIKDKKFRLGNIIEQSIEDILYSKEADYWRAKSKCVIFSPEQIDRKILSSKTDISRCEYDENNHKM